MYFVPPPKKGSGLLGFLPLYPPPPDVLYLSLPCAVLRGGWVGLARPHHQVLIIWLASTKGKLGGRKERKEDSFLLHF